MLFKIVVFNIAVLVVFSNIHMKTPVPESLFLIKWQV